MHPKKGGGDEKKGDESNDKKGFLLTLCRVLMVRGMRDQCFQGQTIREIEGVKRAEQRRQ